MDQADADEARDADSQLRRLSRARAEDVHVLELTKSDPTPDEILRRLQTLQNDQCSQPPKARHLSRGRIDREELIEMPAAPGADDTTSTAHPTTDETT
jgi:hypothetical protein